MNHFPDFSQQDYQIIKELGRNREGGRITWLGSKISTGETIVLKQFCFATLGSSWSGFNIYEKEIKILKELDLDGIPKYLASFPTSDGFCLIQEYKNAPSLEIDRRFTPEEIKLIAIKVLEILVYLQSKIPPIIHRDLKPANILVDDNLNVYLIDFGMSSIGIQEVSGSSVFKGTPGFLPPEQVRKPIEASDLYSLGVTLICLLTNVKSDRIQELTSDDEPYQLNFKHLLPQLNIRFVEWLEKMVEPSTKDRFINAKQALEQLKPLDLKLVPEVKVDRTNLEFKATQLGEIITQKLLISNSIADTLLQGKLLVTANNNDWISFSSPEFLGNQIECQITVDTSKLMAAQTYDREIILQTNAIPENYPLTVKVETATIPVEITQPPYGELVSTLILSLLATVIVNLTAIETQITPIAFIVGLIGAIVIIASEISAAAIATSAFEAVFITLAVAAAIVIVASVVVSKAAVMSIVVNVAIAETVILAYLTIAKFKAKNFSFGTTFVSLLPTIVLGIILGISFISGLTVSIFSEMLGCSLVLGITLLSPYIKQAKLIAKYRQAESERALIEP